MTVLGAPDHVDSSNDIRRYTKYIALDLLQGVHHKTPKHDEQAHQNSRYVNKRQLK